MIQTAAGDTRSRRRAKLHRRRPGKFSQEEEKTRFGIFSTLMTAMTAAKLAPLGILTGIRSNKPVRILLKKVRSIISVS
jgi:hypothetical protein